MQFFPCSELTFENASKCSKESSKYCNSKSFKIKAFPNYSSDFKQIQGSIKIDINQENHDFLDFVIENRPTSQCHFLTFAHIITFDQFKYQIESAKVPKWILFHQNSQDFEIWIEVQNCYEEKICSCGFKTRNVEMNFCSGKSILRGFESYQIMKARNGTLAYVSILHNYFRN